MKFTDCKYCKNRCTIRVCDLCYDGENFEEDDEAVDSDCDAGIREEMNQIWENN